MSFAVPITLKERIELMSEKKIEAFDEDELSDNKAAIARLRDFCEYNYELIRSLRENEAIHENFERHLARIYDAMLDIRFKLRDVI